MEIPFGHVGPFTDKTVRGNEKNNYIALNGYHLKSDSEMIWYQLDNFIKLNYFLIDRLIRSLDLFKIFLPFSSMKISSSSLIAENFGSTNVFLWIVKKR